MVLTLPLNDRLRRVLCMLPIGFFCLFLRRASGAREETLSVKEFQFYLEMNVVSTRIIIVRKKRMISRRKHLKLILWNVNIDLISDG